MKQAFYKVLYINKGERLKFGDKSEEETNKKTEAY